MTAEAPTAAAPPDPAKSPAAVAHPPGQNRRSGLADRGPRAPTRKDGDPARGDPMVADLVTRARNDKQAWDALVERYSPLIWSLCRRHRLGDADAEDVRQSAWLHLVNQLAKVRDPAVLPGWLVTTTRRECLRVLHSAGRLTAGSVLDAGLLPDEQARTAEQEVLVPERRAALR
jgi:hypothetical protein